MDQKSVAVLAFANLSDDKGNDYFSDGINEELLNVLAKVPGLSTAAMIGRLKKTICRRADQCCGDFSPVGKTIKTAPEGDCG